MSSRKIKFRAWDTKNVVFYKPIHKAFQGELWTLLVSFKGDLCAHTFNKHGNTHILHESRFPDRYILEQFTGLHDKNGKEIYEGDIVDFPMRNRKYIVEWHGDGWVLFDGTWKYATADGYRPRDGFGWARTEIIGNIHQNPELLKQDGPEKSKDSA